MKKLILSVVFAFTAAAIAAANQDESVKQEQEFIEVDYSKIDRKIKKEPAYKGKPYYGLFILDMKGEFKAWAVLDISKNENVLYFDKNANGDLTEAGEKLKSNYLAPMMEIDEIKIPDSKLRHKKFSFRLTEGYFAPKGKEDKKNGVFFEMLWNGKEAVKCGDIKTKTAVYFDESIDKAPILRPAPHGKLQFELYRSRTEYMGNVKFKDDEMAVKIGAKITPNFQIGKGGLGKESFCFLSDTFLDLKKDKIFVSIIGKDGGGKELKERFQIKEHC